MPYFEQGLLGNQDRAFPMRAEPNSLAAALRLAPLGLQQKLLVDQSAPIGRCDGR